MQKLCLEMCKSKQIHEPKAEMTPLDAGSEDLKEVLRGTAENFYHDYSTILELLSGNASRDRNGRKEYSFQLKGKGDIYDILLCALALNPPKSTLDRREIIERVQKVCRDERPQSGNLVQTIQRMDRWVSDKVPENGHCFDWSDDRKSLEIPDPYLIFCLRWSDVTDFEPKLH